MDEVNEAAARVHTYTHTSCNPFHLIALSRSITSKGGPECGRYPSLDDLPKSRADDCAEIPPTADGLYQAHGKLVHAAGEISARVNSKAVT